MQHYVRMQITHQKSSVQDSVITAAVKTFEDETFTAFQVLLSKECTCQSKLDCDTKPGRYRMSHCNINQAYITLQLEIIITAFLENVEPLKLDWALLDRCLCCLLQCCLRRKPSKACFIMLCRRKIFSKSPYFAGVSVKLRDCGSKKALLNVLSLRWECMCVFRPEAIRVIYLEIVQCLVKEDSVDLTDLLRCAAAALLSFKAWDLSVGTDGEHAGLIVSKLFATFGITPDTLVKRLRSSNDHRIYSLALWLVSALAVSGQQELAECLLIALIAIWAQRWQTFTVGKKEEFVNHTLGFAYSCAFGYNKDLDRCVYWCDVAFRVNNIKTACSKTFHLSLRACWRATWALCFQSAFQKRRHSIQVVQTWLQRLLPFLHLPNLTVECCRHLTCSLAMLMSVCFISFGASFPLTLNLLGLTIPALLKSTPIYFRRNVHSKNALCTLLLLSSQARRIDELNWNNIRRFCENRANYRNEIVGYCSKKDILESILKQTSLWDALNEECRMIYFSFHVLAASVICCCEPSQRIFNPFIFATAEMPVQAHVSQTSKPRPAVIREVVDMFLLELRRFKKHKSADAIQEAFSDWPKPENTANLNRKPDVLGED